MPTWSPPPPDPREQAFHDALVEDPGDEAAWLILADWLEENDDPRRAELLRLHRRVVATCCQPAAHPGRAAWQARLVELLRQGIRPSVPRHVLRLAPGVEMTFARVPPGSFLMGSPPGEPERKPDEKQHLVTLTQGFWLAVTPVTHAQWRSLLPGHGGPGDDDRPAGEVSWHACQAFCAALSAKTGRRARLPTEAEWEYACRAGTTTTFHFGAAISSDQASYDGTTYGKGQAGVHRRERTPVCRFPANPWGLYDMHGNVWEWCADWLNVFYYDSSPRVDPTGPDHGTARVLRGGSWQSRPWACRAAYRNGSDPSQQPAINGCRVALGPD